MKQAKKIASIIYWLGMVAVLLLAASLFFSSRRAPTAYRVYSVQSGSMAPKIPLGSLVFIRSQNSYSQGDIITFGAESDMRQTTTHRIYEIERDDDIGKLLYHTKGDANNAPDPEPVSPNRVIGKVIYNLPLLGFIVSFAKTQTGFITLIIIPAVLIIYSELLNIKSEIVKLFSRKKHDH